MTTLQSKDTPPGCELIGTGAGSHANSRRFYWQRDDGDRSQDFDRQSTAEYWARAGWLRFHTPHTPRTRSGRKGRV